ncbi:MAG: BON domain-containing protein [Petrimonas sp.]|nr:BON domain-containing protein [Petrimonas sp.]
MKTFRLLSVFTLILALGVSVSSCKKVSDADLQKNAQTVLATMPDAAGVTVSVADQVATLTGTVKDDATKAYVESAVAGVEKIKSVVNNLEVVPPAPDYAALDAAINTGLTDALKDHPKVQATVQDGVITLTGEVKQSELETIMQKLSALNPVQIINNATVK